MKKNKLLTFLSLLSAMTLVGCTNTEQPTNPSTPSVPTSSSTNTNNNVKEIAPDPYASVLEGLDKKKDIYSDAYRGNRTYLGGYTESVKGTKVAYGWIEYEQDWGTSKSSYGVAVKLTITADGKVKSIKLGAPDKDVHNFTPYYARTTGYEIYQDYIANYEKDLNAAFANKSVRNIFKSLKDAVCQPNLTPTEADSGTYTVSKNDKTVKTGATQTAARTERALYAAAAAYLNENNPNSHTFAHVANHLTSADPTGNENKTGFRKTTDGSYGYSRYQQYNSYYGAAVKIKVKANNVIDHVYVGTPRKKAHNFTPWYSLVDPDNFIQFYQQAEELLNNALAGKVVTKELRNKFASAKINLTGGEGAVRVPSENGHFLNAGATQTNARLDLAIASARQGILDTETKPEPDKGGIVDEALEGANTGNHGEGFYGSYNHRKSDYVTPEENQNGYFDSRTNTAYGWRRYENPWAKGSYYGAAVAVSFDTDKTVKDVKVGVPTAGDVNRTSIYRAHYDSDPIYLDNYAQYLQQDRNAALKGNSASDIYGATLAASVENKEGNLIFTPGDYDFLGAGATQTTSRINVALFEAASAYRMNSDPFTKNKFAELTLTKGTDIQDNTFTVGGLKKEGYVYGYTVYYIAGWKSYYGAAVKLSYDAEKKITAIETGEPTITDPSSEWGVSATNFTAKYTFTSTESRTAYYNYYTSVKSAIEKALVEKTINEALAQEFAGAKVEINPADLEATKYDVVEKYRYVGAGATQTDTRISAAIYGALQAALK